jgi:hypothetical protein
LFNTYFYPNTFKTSDLPYGNNEKRLMGKNMPMIKERLGVIPPPPRAFWVGRQGDPMNEKVQQIIAKQMVKLNVELRTAKDERYTRGCKLLVALLQEVMRHIGGEEHAN